MHSYASHPSLLQNRFVSSAKPSIASSCVAVIFHLPLCSSYGSPIGSPPSIARSCFTLSLTFVYSLALACITSQHSISIYATVSFSPHSQRSSLKRPGFLECALS